MPNQEILPDPQGPQRAQETMDAADAHLLHMQQVLHQTAPPSSHGTGRSVLYRCPLCGHPWLMDGNKAVMRLDEATLSSWQARLQADLYHLPPALCRLCGFAQGTGILQVDEYAQGKAYGLNWEGVTPHGAHLCAFIAGTHWLEHQSADILIHSHSPVVLAPETCAAVMHWLAETLRTLEADSCVHVLTAAESQELACDNPPGHGAEGTEGWQWKGGVFLLNCPPLKDTVLLTLALAAPAQEQVKLHALLRLWQKLAELIVSDQAAHDA